MPLSSSFLEASQILLPHSGLCEHAAMTSGQMRTFAIAVMALALSACALRPSNPAAHHTSAAHHLSGARTLRAAAIGFYRSSIHAKVGVPLRDQCRSWKGTSMYVTNIAEGEITSDVERSGSAWIVGLKPFGEVLPLARYKVVREGNGYCVDRVLSN